MSDLQIGHARACITPPVGVVMMGYGARSDPSVAIHDDLSANAVALSDGVQRLVVLALDVCEMPLYTTHLLKGAIMEATGLEPDQILINTSHTHAGPVGGTYPCCQTCSAPSPALAGRGAGWPGRTRCSL